MHRFVNACAVMALACSSVQAEPFQLPPDLIGRWVLDNSAQDFKPICSGLYYDFRPTGLVVGGDGYLETTSTWSARSSEGGYVVSLKPLSSHGEKNCQGLSQQYVREHSVTEAYFRTEANGHKLRIYYGPKPEGKFLLLTKAP
jgi:hypothetical protein